MTGTLLRVFRGTGVQMHLNITYCPVTESYKRIYLPLSYSLVFVFGLGLNGVLLWLVCCRTRRWSCSVVYLANLALADLLYVLTLPLLIITHAMNDVWPFGDFTCKAVRFFFYTNLHCSMMFLVCISVHRFLGVCYPIKGMRYRTKRVAMLISASVWLLVTAETFPTLAFAHTGFINNMTVCFDMTNPGGFKQYLPYGVFLAVVGFLMPFMVILKCNYSMIRVLSQKAGESSQVGAEMRNKTVRTLIIVSLFFVLCFGPYHVTRTIYLFVRAYMSRDCRILNVVMLSYKVWRPLVSFTSCGNPILYFMSCKRKRMLLWEQLCRRRRVVYPLVWTVHSRAEFRTKPRSVGTETENPSKT